MNPESRKQIKDLIQSQINWQKELFENVMEQMRSFVINPSGHYLPDYSNLSQIAQSITAKIAALSSMLSAVDSIPADKGELPEEGIKVASIKVGVLAETLCKLCNFRFKEWFKYPCSACYVTKFKAKNWT